MRSSRFFFFLMIVFAVAAAGCPTHGGIAGVRNAPPREGPIVAFGDSLTFGTGAPQGSAYVDDLSRLIGRPVQNAGKAGDTVADAHARLRGEVLVREPSIVIVLLGGNDYLQRKDLDESLNELQAMIVEIQANGAMTMLLGMKDLTPFTNYSARYKKIAKETGSAYVPDIMKGIWGRPALMSDQFHPNAAGYAVMAKRVKEALQPYLEKKTKE